MCQAYGCSNKPNDRVNIFFLWFLIRRKKGRDVLSGWTITIIMICYWSQYITLGNSKRTCEQALLCIGAMLIEKSSLRSERGESEASMSQKLQRGAFRGATGSFVNLCHVYFKNQLGVGPIIWIFPSLSYIWAPQIFVCACYHVLEIKIRPNWCPLTLWILESLVYSNWVPVYGKYVL